MRLNPIETSLWVLASTATLAVGLEWTRALPLPPAEPSSAQPAALELRFFDTEALDSARRDVINGDPFRLARHPANVAFGVEPVTPAVAVVPPPRPAKPQLRLRGIIGPPWEAILDGVPDRGSGVVVRHGDIVAALQIRRITRDSVVVADADTVWVLTMERPWR
jgi:hypothetical protein